MATLYITEYEDQAKDSEGNPVPVGLEPRVTNQTVAISGAHAESQLFNARTRFVRIHTDAICSFIVGSAPVATTSHSRMAADQVEYFGCPQGGGLKVSVISNT